MEAEAKVAWPSSETEAIDREIAVRVNKMSSGRASAAEISEASKLIRQRGDRMMPGVFQKYGIADSKKG